MGIGAQRTVVLLYLPRKTMSCYYQTCMSALVDTVKGELAHKDYATSPAVSCVTARLQSLMELPSLYSGCVKL